MRRVKLLCALVMLLASQGSQAVSYPLPPEGSRLVGSPLTITIPAGNTQPLEAFAVQYGQGLSNMLEANPGVDVFLPKSGSTLVVPQQLILPDTVREGIVINVAEMRLYYYPEGANTVEVLPIGIGQAGRETPRNWVTAVERKQEAPSWTPTANTRREYAARGESLPAFVPAGPDNPMGLYAIYIGRLYAIHGTNANFGIGLRVSQGCIRLRNDDIKYLFDTVPVGTRVQIIDRPVKFSTEPDGSHWVEVHEPLSRNRSEYESDRKVPLPITPVLRTFISGNDVDVNRGNQALERRSGMPVNISLVQTH
ncbi:L,D-transpeptidase [Citrobacter youngae]|uniref:L,D-transpeptidase n=1 Tax=Citrobacter youngae TaxID=133448 RepID=UPI001905D384|nr:L,D-transpeptidase [Citrobacter youngae]MBJ8957600.1 L,D-transpeptidase [Citrobacter youngae]